MSSAIKASLIVFAASAATSSAGIVIAQSDLTTGITVSDPAGPLPDTTHVPVVLPRDIKCRWVSTSNVHDERTTYPVHAGSVAIDVKNTVHWDGARIGEKEAAVLELVGMGPVKTTQVDEHGKPRYDGHVA
jgi:hypothetical protein